MKSIIHLFCCSNRSRNENLVRQEHALVLERNELLGMYRYSDYESSIPALETAYYSNVTGWEISKAAKLKEIDQEIKEIRERLKNDHFKKKIGEYQKMDKISLGKS